MGIVEFDENLEPEQKEIIEYGLNQLKINLICILLTLIIAAAYHIVWQGCLFLIAFIPLRLYSGGYHANSRVMCNVISFMAIAISFWGIKFLPCENVLAFLLSTVSALVIFLLAPVSNDIKILEPKERDIYKFRTRIITGCVYGILQVAILADIKYIISPFLVALLLVDISLIGGYIKYPRKLFF